MIARLDRRRILAIMCCISLYFDDPGRGVRVDRVGTEEDGVSTSCDGVPTR